MEVLKTTDPADVLEQAGVLLASDPVRTNVIATLLKARLDRPEPGRYWIVDPSAPIGVALQSPLDFPLVLTPMPDGAVDVLVEEITSAGVHLPGVGGAAATAARFAGAWTERTKSAAVPFQGQRIYEATAVIAPTAVRGRMRPADISDRDQLVAWVAGFSEATGEHSDPQGLVDSRLPLGYFWIWDDDGPVSMAALSEAAAGVVRVQAVFTPSGGRGRGYASACVATLTQHALDRGHRCILYTDLGNATSNAIYRAIGYRAAAEVIRYRFE